MRRAVAAFVLVVPLIGHAEFYSGNTLNRYLQTDAAMTARGDRGTTSEGHEAGVALGFIVGVHDVFKDVSICTPTGVTPGQLMEIVRAYFRAVPHRLHETAEKLVGEALSRSFPCAQRQQTPSRNL